VIVTELAKSASTEPPGGVRAVTDSVQPQADRARQLLQLGDGAGARDRDDRRLLASWETWPAALGAAVLYGIGYGAYIAVDQALITQVLPEARDRAKDLGIINSVPEFRSGWQVTCGAGQIPRGRTAGDLRSGA
jgi:hypothetical protein